MPATSPYVDMAYHIEDASWSGLVEVGDRPSPTPEPRVAVSDAMVGIGGGAVACDEMLAARRAGEPVEFYPADMNHQRAAEKARRKGLSPPTDFSGAAAAAF